MTQGIDHSLYFKFQDIADEIYKQAISSGLIFVQSVDTERFYFTPAPGGDRYSPFDKEFVLLLKEVKLPEIRYNMEAMGELLKYGYCIAFDEYRDDSLR